MAGQAELPTVAKIMQITLCQASPCAATRSIRITR